MGFESCLQETCSRVKTSEKNAKESADKSTYEAEKARKSADEAELSAESANRDAVRAESVVIPDEARYSDDAVDGMIATLGNSIWENRQDIEKLKLGVEA